MDFERFTRSMLLAQGGFAVFLQAPPNERAPILEQITGTEIYSRISMKVHERRTEERDKLELLQAELKGIQVLSEEEERELQTGLKEKRSREAELDEPGEGLRKAWPSGWTVWPPWRRRSRNWTGSSRISRSAGRRLRRNRKSWKNPARPSVWKAITGGSLLCVPSRTMRQRNSHGALAMLPEKEKACADALTAETGRGDRAERGADQADRRSGGHQEGARTRCPAGGAEKAG